MRGIPRTFASTWKEIDRLRRESEEHRESKERVIKEHEG